MKKTLGLFLMFSMLFAISCDDDDDVTIMEEEVVVVANRASSSVSFINAETDAVEGTLTIEGSEPMYLVYVPATDKLYVGDRARNQVHVINPDSRAVETSINVGQGVFHMWADGQGNQLWVNNDVDNTTSVIDLESNTVVNTIDLGVKPHDVFLNDAGTIGYISVLLGDETVADEVYAYNTATLERVATKEVGDDPHLYHLAGNNRLYVPNQSGQLYILNGSDLSEVAVVPMEGAHGIFPTPDSDHMFVTNLPGGQLYSLAAATNMQVGQALDTNVPVPHNITVNEAGTKAFVSHSGGMANQVTQYEVENGGLTYSKTHVVQNNPFGISYYKREKQ